MKLNDAGDFCMLYVEPADDREPLLTFISEQRKPVVVMLPVKSRLKVFQHPDDFNDLKQVKRQLDLQVVFVISGNELLRKLALAQWISRLCLDRCAGGFYSEGAIGAFTPAYPG